MNNETKKYLKSMDKEMLISVIELLDNLLENTHGLWTEKSLLKFISGHKKIKGEIKSIYLY